MTTPHSFDQALVLDTLAEGHYRGQTHPAYWNMVGPFGGITAATALRAILLHPRLLGEPLSLTVNYAGAPTTGPFTVDATWNPDADAAVNVIRLQQSASV